MMLRAMPLLLLVALAGCGFHLRGTMHGGFSLEQIHVTASNSYGELQRELEDMLRQSGAEIVDESSAPYVVKLVSERLSRRSVSTSSQISVSEYELRMEVGFELVDGQDTVVIPLSVVSVERIYRFDNQSLVGSSEEEALLSEEMRREIAGNIMGRIDAAVRESGVAVDEDPA